jgi:hypothetical protein
LDRLQCGFYRKDHLVTVAPIAVKLQKENEKKKEKKRPESNVLPSFLDHFCEISSFHTDSNSGDLSLTAQSTS